MRLKADDFNSARPRCTENKTFNTVNNVLKDGSVSFISRKYQVDRTKVRQRAESAKCKVQAV